MASKKKKAKPKQLKKAITLLKHRKVDVEQILLARRQLYLFEVVTEKIAKELVKNIMALDRISNEPIVLYINSPGGSIADGFAIIDCMQSVKSPIITMILGEACSMAGVISVAGDRRVMSKNSVWMAHDGSARPGGKFTDVIHYGEYIKSLQTKMFTFLRQYTKLSEEDLDKAKRGQLWLWQKECAEKGIIDIAIVGEKK